MKAWYPYRYQVVAIEELNAIAAGHDRKVRNIDRAVEDGEFFVVDMSNVDTVRARSGFGEYDDAALVRFLEENIEYEGSKVLLVLDRRVKVVQRWFPRILPGRAGARDRSIRQRESIEGSEEKHDRSRRVH